ncbi:hypothetical protein BKA70DRAFT_1250313 [Coprinopsis sp. MPI-PUGE-AT-0042]|nr:hypothetical protein BKA70DRAFT_1250313 [Coprinopsis sp. MPI-PUGE-AT-0042]
MSSPENSEDRVVAERLKAEGNAFYLKGDFVNARSSYTAALERDPGNAVLYANRAATLLGEKQHLDAAWDCYEAIQLDRRYAKAWGRLGNASLSLRAWDFSLFAFEKGLELLPSEGSDMTDTQRAMKSQFEEGLKKADAAQRLSDEPCMPTDKENALHWRPWDRANALIKAKPNLPKNSSAFVIWEAGMDFRKGVAALRAAKIAQSPDGACGTVMGSLGATVDLLNGIICEERCFINLDEVTLRKLNIMIDFENGIRKGWLHTRSMEAIKQEAISRLAAEGWGALRPALSTTIRGWLLHAFLRSNYKAVGYEEDAYRRFSRAIELLEWGRQQWNGVNDGDRGYIFKKTIVRGAKRLKMQHMWMVLDASEADDSTSQPSFTEDELVQLAEELIVDVESDPIPVDPIYDKLPGQISSFWNYVKGISFCVLAWHHLRKGSYRRAADYYEKSALAYPDDDETHGGMLRASWDCICTVGAPLKEVLPLFRRLRHAIPKSQELWQGSPSMLLKDLRDIEELEMQELYKLVQGETTMDSVFSFA